jgi:hypothetical protein
MAKQKERMKQRFESTWESCVSLFATSAQRLGLSGGSKPRDNEYQRSFRVRTIKRYCPERPGDDKSLWCPVGRIEGTSTNIRAAHLFPYRLARYMEDIFGRRSSRDLFSPRNGLFLYAKIELLLEDGIIAIVPDVEHELADPKHPLNDQVECRAIPKAWEQHKVREYKVIVLDRERRWDFIGREVDLKEDVHVNLFDVDGRKLHFLEETTYSPYANLDQYLAYAMLSP